MRTRALLTALASALLLAGCSSPSGTTASSTSTSGTTSGMMDHDHMAHVISMAGNAFVNGSMEVMKGTTVTWKHNDGTTPHTVTADDGSFDSSPNCNPPASVPLQQFCMVQGNTFTHTFAAEGSFAYHCKVHSGMKGTITVVSGMNMTHM